MPNIPVLPSLTSVLSNSFTINVNPDGNPGGTFYAFRVVFGTTTKFVNSGGILQDDKVFVNVLVLPVTGVLPNTLHSVSLSAADDILGNNETSFGPAASATTLAALPIVRPYENVFSTTLKAVWDANDNPAGTKYFVELSTDPSFVQNVVSSGAITDTGFIFTLLLPNTIHHGRVKAQNANVIDTAFVSLGSTTTPVGPEPVRAIRVTNLLSERGFLITWSPNLETNLTQYNVYRSSSPTDDGEFKVIGTTTSSVTSFVDNVPFTFGIVFYYKVTALDSGNNESALELTTPVQDNTFHSFEEQPFPNTIRVTDIVEDEEPSGLVDTSNTLYTTAFPFRKNTLEVYLNGVRMHRTLDFTEGPGPQQFTFLDPPDAGGFLRVSYKKF